MYYSTFKNVGKVLLSTSEAHPKMGVNCASGRGIAWLTRASLSSDRAASARPLPLCDLKRLPAMESREDLPRRALPPQKRLRGHQRALEPPSSAAVHTIAARGCGRSVCPYQDRRGAHETEQHSQAR